MLHEGIGVLVTRLDLRSGHVLLVPLDPPTVEQIELLVSGLTLGLRFVVAKSQFGLHNHIESAQHTFPRNSSYCVHLAVDAVYLRTCCTQSN